VPFDYGIIVARKHFRHFIQRKNDRMTHGGLVQKGHQKIRRELRIESLRAQSTAIVSQERQDVTILLANMEFLQADHPVIP